ncbi:MAG: S-layer homology domain-containing protein, partial [Desulfotomaculales bacterium]
MENGGNSFVVAGRAAPGFLAVVFLVVFLLAVAGPAPAAPAADYAGHWAEEAIAEIGAAGIMRGYPDGRFAPDGNVTKLETVALLLRTLGLEQQARALDNARVDYRLPSDLYWGRGYLILAVQKGMLDSRYLYQFRPGAPATRVEVAALTSLALPTLKSDGAALSYADAQTIPSGYEDYVARVTRNKIMVGLPGNRFAPNEYFTRAQMAVLLTRLLDGGWANPLPQRRLTGTVRSLEGGALTLEPAPGQTVRKQLATDPGIFRDGRRIAFSDLRPGVRV